MKTLEEKARHIQLVVFDVDGVLTDGRLYYAEDGNQFKAFHSRDGVGLKRLLEHSVEVGIISGRESKAVIRRMGELGVQHIYQGQSDKMAAFTALLKKLKINAEQTVYVGDDLPDLAPMQHAGIAVAVADACPEVLAHAAYQTHAAGGFGVAREVCDWLLKFKLANTSLKSA